MNSNQLLTELRLLNVAVDNLAESAKYLTKSEVDVRRASYGRTIRRLTESIDRNTNQSLEKELVRQSKLIQIKLVTFRLRQ